MYKLRAGYISKPEKTIQKEKKQNKERKAELAIIETFERIWSDEKTRKENDALAELEFKTRTRSYEPHKMSSFEEPDSPVSYRTNIYKSAPTQSVSKYSAPCSYVTAMESARSVSIKSEQSAPSTYSTAKETMSMYSKKSDSTAASSYKTAGSKHSTLSQSSDSIQTQSTHIDSEYLKEWGSTPYPASSIRSWQTDTTTTNNYPDTTNSSGRGLSSTKSTTASTTTSRNTGSRLQSRDYKKRESKRTWFRCKPSSIWEWRHRINGNKRD
jgi:hypothetical protein